MNIPFLIIEDSTNLGASGPEVIRNVPLTEPLVGPDAVFIRYIVNILPDLLVFDLQAEKIPWRRWIQVLKTSAATRRIPVVVFGPHVDEDAFKLAASLGADDAYPRGKFNSSFTKIFSSYIDSDVSSISIDGCDGELSPEAFEGARLHNLGDYFEAHEYFEQAWLAASDIEASLYRSMLQITVIHLHLQRGNYRGALKMLLRLQQWITPLPAHCLGVDVAILQEKTSQLESELLEIDEDEISSYWEDSFKPIRFLTT